MVCFFAWVFLPLILSNVGFTQTPNTASRYFHIIRALFSIARIQPHFEHDFHIIYLVEHEIYE